jgi:Flp pilus assembly pilin Flp
VPPWQIKTQYDTLLPMGDQKGQGLVEYALMAGIIGLMAVIALTLIGNRISNNIFNTLGNTIRTAGESP